MKPEDTFAFQTAFTTRELVPYLRGAASVLDLKVELEPIDMDRLVLRLSKELLAEHLPTEVIAETAPRAVEFAHFLTWWDHFKATYRGRWWMRWRTWEVRYRVERRDFTAKVVVNLERWKIFPDAPFAVPELGQPVKIMRPEVNWIGWMD